MKKLLIIITAIYISFQSLGQINTDSLEVLLMDSKGTEKIDILNILGWELKYNEVNNAYYYSKEALKRSEQENYIKGKVEAYRNLGTLNIISGSPDTTIFFLGKAMEYFDQVDDDYLKAKIYNIYGIACRDKSKFSDAIKYCNMALEIFKQIDDKKEVAGVMNNLGLVYSEINEKDKELEIYFDLLKIEESINNKLGMARTYNNLGNVYGNLGMNKEAIKYFKLAIELSKEVNHPKYGSGAMDGLAGVYNSMGDKENALKYYYMAIGINKKHHYYDWLGNNYHNIALVLDQYYEEDSIDAIIQYFEKGIELYKLTGNTGGAANAILNLTDIYDKYDIDFSYNLFYMGLELARKSKDQDLVVQYLYQISNFHQFYKRYDSAYFYLRDGTNLRNQLEDQKRDKLLAEMAAKYEYEQFEEENQRLKLESEIQERNLKRKNNIIIGIILLSILLSIIVGLVMMLRRKDKKANEALSIKNQEIQKQTVQLEELLATKDKFISVLVHDIRNPFNALIGFLSLIIDDFEQLDKAKIKEYVLELDNVANKGNQLLENLIEWSQSLKEGQTYNPRPTNIKELADEVLDRLDNSFRQKSIRYKNNIDENINLDIDQEMIRVVIRNLLGNALKFTHENGEIRLNSSIENEEIKISISDNGLGMSEAIKSKIFRIDEHVTTLGTKKEKGTGLGLILCKDFVEKNGGDISVESEKGKGSTFTLTFPK
jgi:signal transduction histidine kinase